MLREIDPTNINSAIDLLCEGFPKRSREFWAKGFARMEQAAWNRSLGVPFGYLLQTGDKPAGVMLTLASPRHSDEQKTYTLINLSSWYIIPSQRWRAAAMMKAILAKHDGMAFTDLTANAPVQAMLPLFGFQPTNDGIAIVVIPSWRAWKGGGQVKLLSQVPIGAVPTDVRDFLLAHEALGCVAAAVEDGGKWHPLLFKKRSLRGVPSVQLLHCQTLEVLKRNLGSVLRFLLKDLKLLLIIDNSREDQTIGIEKKERGKKFARGLSQVNFADYAGSELCLFDF